MFDHRHTHRAVPTMALALAILIVIPLVLLLSGCGGDTPQGAVQKFFSSWQAGDWNAYKQAVIPGQNLTKDQEELAKQKFNQIKVKFQDLKTEVKTDPKDKNKATVSLTGGKITYTADILGKQQSETQDIAKMDPKDRPFYDVVKINGVWYVDYKLG